MSLLSDRFLKLAPTEDKKAVRDIRERLLNVYRLSSVPPVRSYHALPHIEDGLAVYDELFPETPLPPLKFFAWAYHDYIYDSTRSDNEVNSAIMWWRDAPILGFSMAEADEGSSLILATDPSAEPLSVINDMDLAQLGASPEVFNANTAKIREEYSWVEPEVWRKGRSAVLLQFLKRDKLYVTPPFAEKFTDQAIANLSTAIIKLEKG